MNGEIVGSGGSGVPVYAQNSVSIMGVSGHNDIVVPAVPGRRILVHSIGAAVTSVTVSNSVRVYIPPSTQVVPERVLSGPGAWMDVLDILWPVDTDVTFTSSSGGGAVGVGYCQYRVV